MRHRDERGKPERPEKAIDPARIGRDCSGNNLDIPSGASDRRVLPETVGLLVPEMNGQTRLGDVITACYVTAIGKCQPAAYTIVPMIPRKRCTRQGKIQI